MAFRILPLEERIVLDAAVPEADDALDLLDGPNGDAVADADAADSPDGDADGDAPEAAVDLLDGDDGDADALYDGVDPVDGDADAGVRVVVINTLVRDADVLTRAVDAGVLTVEYDASQTSAAELLDFIRHTLDGEQADSIALVNHNLGQGRFQLASDTTVGLGELLLSADQQAFWRDLGGCLETDGRIDLLACGVADTDEGEILVAELEALTGVNVAASDDATGNPGGGGDWVLETDGIDAAQTYFRADALAAFDGALGTVPFGAQNVLTTTADNANDLTAADLDGDGDLDLVAVSINDDTVAWYENTDGAGAFGAEQVISIAADGAASVNAGDVDGDGDTDLVVACLDGNAILWYQNDGGGNF
ncbi:MAG: DUF4347 domain-containing protein, partial [Planctomycetota bacterium]